MLTLATGMLLACLLMSLVAKVGFNASMLQLCVSLSVCLSVCLSVFYV